MYSAYPVVRELSFLPLPKIIANVCSRSKFHVLFHCGLTTAVMFPVQVLWYPEQAVGEHQPCDIPDSRACRLLVHDRTLVPLDCPKTSCLYCTILCCVACSAVAPSMKRLYGIQKHRISQRISTKGTIHLFIRNTKPVRPHNIAIANSLTPHVCANFKSIMPASHNFFRASMRQLSGWAGGRVWVWVNTCCTGRFSDKQLFYCPAAFRPSANRKRYAQSSAHFRFAVATAANRLCDASHRQSCIPGACAAYCQHPRTLFATGHLE